MNLAQENLQILHCERDGKPKLLQYSGRLSGTSMFIGDGVTDYETRHVVDKMVPYFGVVNRPFVTESGLEAYGGKNLLGLFRFDFI